MKKQKTATITLLMVLLFSVLISGCSETAPKQTESEQEATLASYQKTVILCAAKIDDQVDILEVTGDYVHSIMNNNNKYWASNEDHSFIVDNGLEIASKSLPFGTVDRTNMDARYNGIQVYYKEALNTKATGSLADEIDINLKTLYTSYDNLYHLVFEPYGTAYTFADNLNEYITDAKTSYRKLQELTGGDIVVSDDRTSLRDLVEGQRKAQNESESQEKERVDIFREIAQEASGEE